MKTNLHCPPAAWLTVTLTNLGVQLLLLTSFLAQTAFAAGPVFERLKSFGLENQFGVLPSGNLIQGRDGVLYGTTAAGGSEDAGTVFKLNPDGSGYTMLRTFRGNDGIKPAGALLQAADGTLYGTTQITVFKLNPDGSGFVVLRDLAAGGDGHQPTGALVQDGDGVLYGLTTFGGSYNYGTAFRLSSDGSGFTVLKTFTTSDADGAHPFGSLLLASDGLLYGTASYGGAYGYGTVFKINRDGSGFTVLKHFTHSSGDGGHPVAGLIQTAGGTLYGTTASGSSGGYGTVFKLNTDGSGYAVLKGFPSSPSDGREPRAALLQASDGALYGTTLSGGSAGCGTVFRLNPDGTGYTVLKHYAGGDGRSPYASLIQASDGDLYGITYYGGIGDVGAAFKLELDGSGYTVIKSFTGGDARYPYAGLVQTGDGFLYGTTISGGDADVGAVFKLNRDGSGYSIVRSFRYSGGDGRYPYGGLLQASDGALYGTSYAGGSAGGGTVFKLDPDGSGYTVLKSFVYAGGDGYYPYAALVQASDGALYGTTIYGGSAGVGTLFKLHTDGSGYTMLKSFTGPDGQWPQAALLQASDGALYGTTRQGGSANRGTVFKLNLDGSGFTVLKSFTGGDGRTPCAALVQATDSALYGTTFNGGSADQGVVFKLNHDGSGFAVIRSFTGNDGRYPYAGLCIASDGALYGTTTSGGSSDHGTVFKLNPDGSGYTMLKHFTGADGHRPHATPVQGRDGGLYGTTYFGGDMGLGTVFRILVNSPPVARCKSVSVSAAANCTAVASIDDGSSDPDGDAITLTQDPPGPYPIGAITVTLTVADNQGASASCQATVTVVDTTPPTITAPAAVVVNTDAGKCDASNVTLGTPVTSDNCGVASVVHNAPAVFPKGTTVVTWTVTDTAGGAVPPSPGGTWTTKAQMPSAGGGSGAGVINGKLYVPTGDGIENSVYDPVSDSWAVRAPIPTHRADFGCGVINGKLYVVGGVLEAYGFSAAAPSALLEVYDPATDTWEAKAPMPTPRTQVGAGVIDGKLYVVGGTLGGWAGYEYDTLEVYDPATDTWTTKAPMPTPRNTMDAAVIDGQLWVFGGVRAPDFLTTVEAYDPQTDTWSTKTSMPAPRANHAVALVDGILYVVGGSSASSYPTTVYAYDPLTDTWTTTAPLPEARWNLSAMGLDGTFYVFAGVGSAGATRDLWAFTPPQPPSPSGNQSTAAQTVTVIDTEPPTITAPPPVLVGTDPGQCMASGVNLGTPVTADNCGVASVANNAPAVFPKGVTTTTWTVTDTSGNQTTATQIVSVKDAEIPTITAPADVLVVSDAGSCCATGVALGTPTTADNCAVANVVNDHPSTTFPLGETLVTWTVTDSSGNAASCEQKVTVLASVSATFFSPLAGQPVANKIRHGQVVPHKVALVDCSGTPVTAGVTVKLKVQGTNSVSGGVFQDVLEDANGVGDDGTVTSDGIMVLADGKYQFNLDTSNFGDPNTLADPSRYYRSTVTVVDNATLMVLGTASVNLETRR